MAITTKNFTTLVQDQVTAVQASAKSLVDLTVGSILRAVVEATAAVALWLQGLILQLLATTRASTSVGSDLDSWVADFGLSRVAAIASIGQVTFARFTATSQAIVPIGSSVQTGDGTQKYLVTVDTTNPAYSSGLGGYVLASGTSSVTVPVLAVTPGAAGNAQAGQINTLTSAIPGIDTVTNTLVFTSGANSESDAALRVRFVNYLASLSKATKSAIGNAITSLLPGLTYSFVENITYAGTTQYGYFYVVVDDGTGAPTLTLLTSVSNAIDAVRPVTSSFGVFAPVLQNASIAMTVSVSSGYDPVATKALVSAALKTYINALGLGQTLTYSRLAQVAYDASPGVTNVTAVTLNGATADLNATNQQVIKWLAVTVS